MKTQTPLIVSGASGKLGQKVLHTLLDDLQLAPNLLIALTRSPEKLADFAERGVSVRHADFDDPSTLVPAFKGGKRLLLISTDALDVPGKRLEQHRQAIKAAEQADVQHILYTSMPKPEGSALLIAADHELTEKTIQVSNMSHTILRNNWYFENVFLEIHQVLASGTWPSAAGQGKVAQIAHDDAAMAAAYALAADDFENKTLNLTGAKAFTIDEQAELISKVTGKAINVVHVTDEEKVAGMVAAGMPEPLAQVFTSFDTNTRNGGVEEVSQDFTRLTGKEPIAYADWLVSIKGAFEQN